MSKIGQHSFLGHWSLTLFTWGYPGGWWHTHCRDRGWARPGAAPCSVGRSAPALSTASAHRLCASTCIPLTVPVSSLTSLSSPGVRKCSCPQFQPHQARSVIRERVFSRAPTKTHHAFSSMHPTPSIPGSAWQEAALWARTGLGPAPPSYGVWAKPLPSHQRLQSLKPMQKAVLDPKIRPWGAEYAPQLLCYCFHEEAGRSIRLQESHRFCLPL